MNIQGIQNQPAYAPEKLQETKKPETPAASQQGTPAPRYDEYIPEESERQPVSSYRAEPGEDGRPRTTSNARKDGPAQKAERCTANTDNIDREIEKLKQEREQVARQLQSVDDPQKTAELQQRLARLDSELAQKDNDAYRRQHTVFS